MFDASSLVQIKHLALLWKQRFSRASLALFFLWIFLPCKSATSGDVPDRIAHGRKIYEEGILASGGPLRGYRPGGIVVEGAEAACVLCHRRSGMGLSEGANLVPAVTGPSLFANYRQSGHRTRLAPGIAYANAPSFSRPPYIEKSLAHAIRQGVSPSGYRFQYLMPRYELGDADMEALIAYLRVLSAQPSPGADKGMVHFSTVIAPHQNAEKSDGMVDVLNACLAERHPPDQQWRLHVWNLVGEPDTWRRQLETLYATQNVFAMVSGFGIEEWAPVHDFCETNGIPCLFPNTAVPGSPTEGAYSFYFSRGVILEAEVIASYLSQGMAAKRVVQLIGSGGINGKAAAALRKGLEGASLKIEDHVLASLSLQAIRKVLDGLVASDALVLWLNEAELAEIMKAMPTAPGSGLMFVSGWLSGLGKSPLTPDWKQRVLVVYPFDTPSRWMVRMNFNLRPWLKGKGIERKDERLMGNTLAACNLLTEGMLRLRGVLSRDYLVELTENYPVNMGNAPGPQAFPRFTLGPGQRYSSKGAYILRFASPDGARLEPVVDWMIP